jgi:tRNA(fMet)-specific endonuclease VapC
VRYTLDTNAVSALINGDTTVVKRWKQARAAGHAVTINAVSYYEVRRGLLPARFARKLAAFEQLLQAHNVLPLALSGLDRAAAIYDALRSSGVLLEDADILIAGIALANNATLVTHNTRHFARVRGLKLEDWET